ncbi:HAMP domain-containing histidine kinase [Akkermansiaceae bacterium]|nr:HAMP domain-containing histidine kinase [Akkermansiaceae bacterium]
MAKVAAWLAVHLLVLAVAFALFVSWQLRLGLDSLLTGTTGERLESLGKDISASLDDVPESGWGGIIAEKVSPYGLEGLFRSERELGPDAAEAEIPAEIIARAKGELPPPGGQAKPPEAPWHEPRGGPGGFPPPDRGGRPREQREPRALFLTRDPGDGSYWAAIELAVGSPGRGRPPRGVLFLKSDNASANGLFFDYRPWLFGGLAVLAFSILFWAPFVLGITRYAGRISKATGKIAEGGFDTKIGASRNDELGAAGESIEEMSARLGQLLSGQKRFLGDVAHELCAPLARMRTGLGILRESAGGQAERIESIDEDAEELSALVAELLAFTRASSAAVEIETIPLAGICRELAAKELDGHAVGCDIAAGLCVKADRRHLARALGNILRNCHRHAGAGCKVSIAAHLSGNTVNLVIEDDGPGVADEEQQRLFEPFYRPDRSRTRDTGGSGLGMAIVEGSVRACGGKVAAGKSAMGGLLVGISLPRA